MRFASRAALFSTLICTASLSAQMHAYRVDCTSIGSETLHSLEAVNALHLQPGDSLLFRRGDTCKGALQPQGSGTAAHPIHISAYGSGALPRILATSNDPSALSLFNQEYVDLDSLDISGSSTYGIHISGDSGILHNITLRNLNIHNIRGTMKKKESGLIVIAPSKPAASFSHVVVENVRAFDTTQWSGIFISGPSRTLPADDIVIRNAVVHDVQGDGIVLFNAHNSGIYHSLAWHTGMQHQQSIGTPNAIWTWQCDHCTVEGNEAFLVDSPGVDGGAFDIDWGNTANTVRNNFGHDTVGYCIAIFGANGPTRNSIVDNNLCLHNGLSPRLAQRQGAILLMTWGTGSIEGATITNNRVDWHVGENTPLVQTGSKLQASNVHITDNEFYTTGTQVIDDVLASKGERNRQISEDITTRSPLHATTKSVGQWRLIATAGASATNDLTLLLKSAALQFHYAGLNIELIANADLLIAAHDAQLELNGVQLTSSNTQRQITELKLINASGIVVHRWSTLLSFSELGLTLRQTVGEPNYGRLPTLSVQATD